MKPKTIEDIKFYPLQRRDKKTGEFPIDNLPVIAKFSYDGKRLEYNTGIRVSTVLNADNVPIWDPVKMRATRNSSHHGLSFADVNRELNRVVNAILAIYDRYRLAKEPLPLKIFLESVRIELESQKPVKLRLIDAFRQFIDCDGGSAKGWSKGLKAHFEVIRRQVEDTVNGLPISEVDVSIFEAYRKHLLKIDTRNSTIENKLKRLKWFLRWCIEQKNFINGDVAQKILNHKIAVDKIKESDRIRMNLVFLYPDELKAIEQAEIPSQKQYLERARDCFIFCVHTSLRYGDLKNLRKADVKNDAIEIFSQKGSELITIDLTNKAKVILDKYKELPGEYALPVPSNEKLNEFLKELGAIAELNRELTKTYFMGQERKTDNYELWQVLSTHVARRTFVTLGSELGVPADVLMSCTGHDDLKMLKIYKGLRSDRRRQEMQKFNSL